MDIISQPNVPQKDVKQLLEENQRLLKLILHNTDKTRKYILLGRVVGLIYLLLIVGSVVLAAVTLPPLLGSAIQPYKELISGPQGEQVNPDLMDEMQRFLEDYN